MKLTNLQRTVTTTLSAREKEPRKALVQVGQLKITAKSHAKKKKRDRVWTWRIIRRGTASSRGLTVKTKSSFKKLKKWPKGRKKQRLAGTVKATYDLGYGPVTQTFKVYDRGPEAVRGSRITRYSIIYKTVRVTKSAKVLLGTQMSVSRNTIKLSKEFINSKVNALKNIKVKAPVYVIIRPKENTSRAKFKAGFSSLKEARADLTRTRKHFLERLIQGDALVKELEREWSAPDDSLDKFKKLPRPFRRSTRSYAGKGMKIRVHGFTKRVDSHPNALSEVLAYRLVRWWSKPPKSRSGRWQSVFFTLTRWGRKVAGVPPCYTVTDEEGKDVIFAKPSPKEGLTEQELADTVAYEAAERVVYTKSPVKLARAELDKKALAWVKMLQRAPMIEEKPWLKVARGEGKERAGHYEVKVIKWGLRKDYPAIYTDKEYAYLGGVILEVRKPRSKRTLKEWEWNLVRPRTLKTRKQFGAVIVLGKGRTKIGSYSSAHRARNAVRKMLNDKVYSIRMRKSP